MTEKVSIIIPCYHSGKYIKECADSLINQTYKEWVAYFMIDDYYYDDTLKTLLDYNEPRFKMTYRTGRTTCSTARNAGFSECHGDFIAFMDSDDWWEPSKLEIQVRYMEDEPWLYWTSHFFIEHREGMDFLRATFPGDYPSIGSVATILFRKHALINQIAKYGEVFNSDMDRADDGDLVLRILHFPHENLPSYLYHYRWTPGSLTGQTSAIRESWIITKMCFNRRSWKYFWYYLKNTIACIIKGV